MIETLITVLFKLFFMALGLILAVKVFIWRFRDKPSPPPHINHYRDFIRAMDNNKEVKR